MTGVMANLAVYHDSIVLNTHCINFLLPQYLDFLQDDTQPSSTKTRTM